MTVNIFDMAQTWNNGATTFSGIKLNVTDTASAAASNLMDLQVGGSSRFRATRDGHLVSGAGNTTGAVMNLFVGSRLAFEYYGGTSWGEQPFNIRATGGLAIVQGYLRLLGDVHLHRDAANTLAQRNGANAQAFNIYNTYTDASNYERGFIKWNANVLEIGNEKAGTGANRLVSILANGGVAASFGLGSTVGSASSDINHSWIQLRNSVSYASNGGIAQINAISQVALGGTNASYKFLHITSDAMFASRHQMTTDTFTFYVQDEGTQDKAHKHLLVRPENAHLSNTVNITGGNLSLFGGMGASGSAGAAHGGNVTISGGNGYGTGHHGYIILANMPTSSAGLPTGAIWNDLGTLKIA